MKSSLVEIVVTQLTSCSSGEITAAELHEFLAPIVWALDNLDDKRVEELVYSAELILSEFDAGHRTEEGFRESLKALCGFELAITNTVNTFSEIHPITSVTLEHNELLVTS